MLIAIWLIQNLRTVEPADGHVQTNEGVHEPDPEREEQDGEGTQVASQQGSNRFGDAYGYNQRAYL